MKKILTVIDVQNDFITGSLENAEAQKKVPAIAQKVKGFSGDAIFVTLDSHSEDYLSTKEGERLPVLHCIPGTQGWKIPEEVQVALDGKECPVFYIKKPAFGAPELAMEIEDFLKGDSCTIEMVGFISSICLISNALILKSWLYNTADISIDAACTAGLNPENNASALEVASSCHIDILNND